MRRLHVSAVATALPPSGVARSIEQLVTSETLQERFIFSVVTWSAEGSVADTIRRAGVPVYNLQAPHGHSLKAARRYRQLLKSLAPDVLHYFSRPLLALASQPRIPTVSSFHVFPSTAGASVTTRLVHFRAANLIAITRDLAQFLKQTYGIETQIIPHGTPEPTFVHLAPREDLTLVLVSRLVPGKGLELLPFLADELRERGLRVLIKVYGWGSLEERILDMERRNPGVIEYCGPSVNLESPYTWNAPLLFLSERETYGRPVVEAMARGIPTVSAPLPQATKNLLAGTRHYEARQRTVEDICDEIQLCHSEWSLELAKRLHLNYQEFFRLEAQQLSYAAVWERAIHSLNGS